VVIWGMCFKEKRNSLKTEQEYILQRSLWLLKIYIKEILFSEILSQIMLFLMTKVMHYSQISVYPKKVCLIIKLPNHSAAQLLILLLKCLKDQDMENLSIGISLGYSSMRCLLEFHHIFPIIGMQILS
jgi:hypothetical protein